MPSIEPPRRSYIQGSVRVLDGETTESEPACPRALAGLVAFVGDRAWFPTFRRDAGRGPEKPGWSRAVDEVDEGAGDGAAGKAGGAQGRVVRVVDVEQRAAFAF